MIVGVMISDVINSWRILETFHHRLFAPHLSFQNMDPDRHHHAGFQGFNVLVKELYLLIKGKELII